MRRGIAIVALLAPWVPAQAARAQERPPVKGCVAVAGAGRAYLQPTGLRTYVLSTRAGTVLARGAGASFRHLPAPGPAGEWVRRGRGRRTLLLAPAAGGRPVRVRRAEGCVPFPEAELDATGRPFSGKRRDGTVFGFADAHVHITADMRAGGRVIHGKAFDRFGIAEALGHDADDHGPDGTLDVTGNLLRSGNPAGTHDTDGWPTFAGWPTYDTNTHQQVYYRWLERMWMAGMRLVVAQTVEDQPLCEIEPLKSHSCDETATIALEVARLRGLQDYVDAQAGGPGKGWFRIVEDPRSARRVIEQGKLAVVIGVESSNPFGCSELRGVAQCDRSDIDAGIRLYRSLGISGLFLAHWVDNALAGAALEGGDKGLFIGTFEAVQTGGFFATGPCPEPSQGEEPVPAYPAALAPLVGPAAPVLAGNAPLYPEGRQCNVQGLTPLGEYAVERLMDNHMLIEADHLSERTRLRVLELAEARHYPLVSSHTDTGGAWTPSTLRRLFAIGGFATARPDAAAKLAGGILRFAPLRARGQYLGVGLGSDTGGFATLPGPDTSSGHSPLAYPFRSYDGKVVFERQRSGDRVFDLNTDGVAHYGLFADLLADMGRRPGGREAERLLFRSAEAYLRTWERTGR